MTRNASHDKPSRPYKRGPVEISLTLKEASALYSLAESTTMTIEDARTVLPGKAMLAAGMRAVEKLRKAYVNTMISTGIGKEA